MTRFAISRTRCSTLLVASAIALISAGATAQTPPPPQTSAAEPQTPSPAQAPGQATAPNDIPPGAARQFPAPSPTAAAPASVMVGPTRELKLAENTWFRFGAQVQAWFKVAQDRIQQADGSDGNYANDFYCRRCRLFVTGSVVKDVTFNLLFEAANFGKADVNTGAKVYSTPSLLDAYAQVKFANAFSLSAGNILLPLTRNGTQPTTTYVSIDNANVDVTPILQGNSTVIRDVGVQASGFFLDDRLEYRVGLFQGSRAAAVSVTAGTPPVTKVTQTAGHNFPRFVSYLQYNFWDTEKGYVNGGHYYGTKKVLGVQANFDYQGLGNGDPPKPGTDKDPYIGASAAAFINYPLSGAGDAKKGGDEIVVTAQFGYYDGGGSSGPNLPTYAAVLRQTNYLLEGGYYNRDLKMSFFGKFETRKIQPNLYSADVKARNNNNWYAVGMKYYFAPANLANIAVQYERVQFPDAPSTQQGGTNNVTVQMQTLLY